MLDRRSWGLGLWTTMSIAVLVLLAPSSVAQGQTTIFINEIHYDNVSTDEGEAIEIAGPAGTDLNGWSVVLYNGNGGLVYNTLSLTDTLPESCPQAGVTVIDLPTNGLQNGAPDGMALVDAAGNVVEFLSYEGSFTAVDGPAAGATSVDIGVSESGSTPPDASLQLSNVGWLPPGTHTFGQCNADQVSERPVEPEPTPAKIHEIQGSGPTVTGSGPFEIQAIVVGDFQGPNQLSGFFVQEEDTDGDGDPNTSEGIFVFCDTCPVEVDVGDAVLVIGSASDPFGLSRLTATDAGSVQLLSTGEALPTPTSIDLPVATTASDLESATDDIDAFYEPFEAMLVTFLDRLTVDEYFELARFGQIVLSEGRRPRQFTDTEVPSEAGFVAHQIDLATRRIILDDDNSRQNSALFNGTPVFHPLPGFSVDNFFRGGDTFEELTGVLSFAFGEWRVRPVTESFTYIPARSNPRTNVPEDVGGSLKVASFNVLNYFTTLDEGPEVCAPSGDLGCRGANTATELERQTDKIVSALCDIKADIVGLVELENNASASLQALTDAVAAAGCGTYAFVDTGPTGTDAIKVGLIYKDETVEPIGTTAVQDDISFTDPADTGQQKNRPGVAQAFVEKSSGETLIVVVNHLKSKGSRCGEGDDSPETGAASCNLTRTLAAEAQVAWLGQDPTETGTEKILIIGDLNAYRREAPIGAYRAGGYSDLIDELNGKDAYSFLFDGQLGYLDYALANEALRPSVTGVTEWHINADEVNLLDYNDPARDPGEESFEAKPAALPLFRPSEYRSSDHDPLVVGLRLANTAPSCDGLGATIYVDAEGAVVGGPQDGQRYRGVLIGSSRGDVIVGTNGRDLILAGSGPDVVCAGGANDFVLGGPGDDKLFGESGRDRLFGGPGGSDVANGGEGQDSCFFAERSDCE